MKNLLLTLSASLSLNAFAMSDYKVLPLEETPCEQYNCLVAIVEKSNSGIVSYVPRFVFDIMTKSASEAALTNELTPTQQTFIGLRSSLMYQAKGLAEKSPEENMTKRYYMEENMFHSFRSQFALFENPETQTLFPRATPAQQGFLGFFISLMH